MLRELVKKNRSFRRFDQKFPVPMETLKELVDIARICPSGANKQPLKYIISNSQDKNADIFSTCAWAGYLTEWEGPDEGERPSAYIIILLDKGVSNDSGCDHGIAAQTILLGAAERGLGGCMIGSVQREKLSKLLKIPENYGVLLVVALGKPAEKVVLEEAEAPDRIRYYRDADDVHRVPKRKLEDIILNP